MKHKFALAPWELQGNGYILLYRFDRAFLASQRAISEEEINSFSGGFGAVMLVDYQSSNVGPYHELLIIPGRFNVKGEKWAKITRIYVSTSESVVNGRKNWGIPKERADFTWSKAANGWDVIEVSREGYKFFEASLKPFGPKLPVRTASLPFPLMQEYEGQFLQTTFTGKGYGRLAKLTSVWADERFFPNIALAKPVAVTSIKDFNIIFPEAKTVWSP